MADYAGALITGFYAAFDRLDWPAVAAAMTPDCRWTLLATGEEPVSDTGRDSILTTLPVMLGGVETIVMTVTAVLDEGTAAAVFTTAATTRDGVTTTTGWLDSFRFEDGRVADYVSLQIG